MDKNNISLKTKNTVFVFLIISIIAVSTSISISWIVKRGLIKNYKSYGKILGDTLSITLKNYISQERYSNIETTLESLLKENMILGIQIVDKDRILILAKTKNKYLKHYYFSSERKKLIDALLKSKRENTIIYSFGMDVVYPMYKDKDFLGILIITLDISWITDLIRYIKIALFISFTLLLTVLILLTYIKDSNLSKDISELERAIKEVSNGNLNIEVALTADHEMLKLSDSFNRMLKDIKAHYEYLENMIKERTTELEKVSSRLRKFLSEKENEISFIKKMQMSILPESLPELENIKTSHLFLPIKDISSDFFDAFMIDEDTLFLYVIDVFGKGILPALMTMRIKTSILTHINSEIPINKIFEIINNDLYSILSEFSYYFSIFAARINTKTLAMEYLGAGSLKAVYYDSSNGDIKTLESENTVIGITENAEYSTRAILMKEGDKILIYTDGLPKLIGEDMGVSTIIKNNIDNQIEILIKSIEEEIKRTENKQEKDRDDITIVGIEILKGEKTNYTHFAELSKKYVREGRYNKALRILELGKEIFGESFASCYNLASIYYKLGKVEEAKKEIEKALEFKPGSEVGLSLKKKILEKLQ